jgi:hypothetical protein
LTLSFSRRKLWRAWSSELQRRVARRDTWPTNSGSKSKPNKKPEKRGTKLNRLLPLISSLAYYLTLKMKAYFAPRHRELSQLNGHHKPHDRPLQVQVSSLQTAMKSALYDLSGYGIRPLDPATTKMCH